MVKAKKSKVKKAEKVITPKEVIKPKEAVEKKIVEKKAKKVDLAALEGERNGLIASIKGKLLSNSALKRGGSNVRVKYAQERGYLAVIDEINELGKVLGYSKIGLGHLRGR